MEAKCHKKDNHCHTSSRYVTHKQEDENPLFKHTYSTQYTTYIYEIDVINVCWRYVFWRCLFKFMNAWYYYNDVIMNAIASQITSLTIVYSVVYSGADQRKHQSSAPLALVWGIHRWPVNSPHKWPVTRKMCPFDDVGDDWEDSAIRHMVLVPSSIWARH